mgnify:CR=1 FL=1
MGILPVLKVKTESRCNLLTTILYDSSLSFSMMVKDIGSGTGVVAAEGADSVLKELLSALCAVYQLFIVAEYTEGYFEFQGIGEVRMINGKSLK